MNQKRVLAFLFTVIMLFSGGAGTTKAVKADEGATTYKFLKQYRLNRGDSTTAKSPAEIFRFGINGKAQLYEVQRTKYNTGSTDVLNVNNLPNGATMPEAVKYVTLGQAEFEEGAAKNDINLAQKDVSIQVPDASSYPGTGYYFYKFQEVEGDTAGVTYNTNPYLIRVAVTYDNSSKDLKIANVSLYSENDRKKTVGIENTYASGRLSVQKVVTGNMADPEELFDVTVTFNAPQGKKIKGDIVVTAQNNADAAGNEIMFTGKGTDTMTTTFKVKANTVISFANIPSGVSYDVTETKANGYEVTYKTDTQVGQHTGQIGIGVNGDPDVIITNSKNSSDGPETGVFLTNLPYFLVLAAVAAGVVIFAVNKRRHIGEE